MNAPVRTSMRNVWLAAGLCLGVAGAARGDGPDFRIVATGSRLVGVMPGVIGGKNLAAELPVKPLSNVVAGDPSDVTDDDYTSHWYSYQGQNSQIQFTLDLGAMTPIGRFVSRLNQTENYLIATSDDGVAWTNRHAGSRPYAESHGQAVVVTNDANGAYSARYIRYTGSNSMNAYAGVTEFEVFRMEPDVRPLHVIGATNRASGLAVTPLSNVVVGDPSYVTDGDYASHWYSYQGQNSQIQFMLDLGAVIPIGRFVSRLNQTEDFLIATSENGVAWTNRHAGSRPYAESHGQAVVVTNDPNGAYAARYIRYTGSNGTNAYAGVTEFEVFGMEPAPLPPGAVGTANLAAGRKVIALSNVVVGDPSDVTDADYGTHWYSYQGPSGQIQFMLDLGEVISIGRFVSRLNQTEDFVIATSEDSFAWTNRHVGSRPYDDSHGKSVVVTNEPNGAYAARYIRYTGSNNMNAYVGVTEFEVFGMLPQYKRVTSMLVEVPSTLGRFYTLQRRGQLVAGRWMDVPGQVDIPGVNGPLTLEDALPTIDRSLYRVIERESPR